MRPDIEVIQQIKLGDIFADYDWNSRSKKDVTSTQSDGAVDSTTPEKHGEGTGLPGLMSSLRANGQDTPVVVRKVEDGNTLGGKKTVLPFELVCGFRRYTAIYGIRADIPNLPAGYIRAVIRKLSPVEARLLNLRENTDRASLTTPDLVCSVRELRAQNLTQAQIADALSLSVTYISRLAKIATLPAKIVQQWRGEDVKLSGIPTAANGGSVATKFLPSSEMLALADTVGNEAEKTESYTNLILGKTPEKTVTRKDRFEEKAAQAGTLAGLLVRSGVLDAGHLRWEAAIGPKRYGYVIDCGPLRDPKLGLQKLWNLAKLSYEKAIQLKGISDDDSTGVPSVRTLEDDAISQETDDAASRQ